MCYIQSESENMKIKMKIKLLENLSKENLNSSQDGTKKKSRGIVYYTDPVPWGATKANLNKFQHQYPNLLNFVSNSNF